MKTAIKCAWIGMLLAWAMPVFADDTQVAYCKIQGQSADTTMLGRYLGKSPTDATPAVGRATDGLAVRLRRHICIRLMA